jgi:hypothetical protein
MPALYFPDKRFLWGFSNGRRLLTDIEDGQGREQRRIRYGMSRATLSGTLEAADVTMRQVMRDFATLQAKGRAVPFYIFAWPVAKYLAVNFGGYNGLNGVPVKGDGASTAFQIGFGNPGGNPANNSVVTAVYAAGVSKAFTLANNFYTNGEDKITFNSYTPANNELLTLDITGRERIAARFQTDESADVPFETANTMSARQVSVIEVLYETP